MPSNLVHNAHEEAAWERAKAAVRKQYPDIEEGQPRFYKLTTTIYENMKALDADCGEEIHKAQRVVLGVVMRRGQR